jgi:hypothetical protein
MTSYAVGHESLAWRRKLFIGNSISMSASPRRKHTMTTSAFYRTNVEFGKHWSLSALARRQQLSQGSLSRKCDYSAKRREARSN